MIECNRSLRPSGGGGDQLCRRVRHVPGGPHTRRAGTSRRISYHPTIFVSVTSQVSQQSVAWNKPWTDKHHTPRNNLTGGQLDAVQSTVCHRDPGHVAFYDANPPDSQPIPLGAGQLDAIRKEDNIVRPLAHQRRLMNREGPVVTTEYTDRRITNLVPVTVGTMQNVDSPAILQPSDVRQLVT